MVVDLGCLRTVAGVKWVVQEIARCRAQGRFVEIRKTLDYFRFGDGERRPSHYRVFLEVGLAQHVGLLAINAVEYPCPPLLSKGVCSALGLQLDCGSGRFDLTNIGVRGQHFTTSQESQEGHFLLSVDNFHPAWPQWQQLLTAGHIPKIQHEEIQCFELRSGEPVGRGARRARPHSSHVAVRTTVRSPSPSRPSPSIHGGATAACSGGGGNSPDCVVDRRGGRVGVRSGASGGRAIAAPEDSPWHPPGREHGEASHGQGLCNHSPGQEDQGLSGSGIDSGGRDRPEEPQEGVNQILVQEGAGAGSDGTQCRVSDPGDDPQRGRSLQYELGQVEAARVDGACSECPGGGGAPLQAPPPLVGHDVLARDGRSLGTPRGRCEDAAGASRPAADEVRVSQSITAPPPSQHAWNRGQVQRLKHSIKQAKHAITQWTLVAKCSEQSCWKVLENFGGSANLSLIAKSTGKWIALEPVDLMYGSDLLTPQEQALVLSQLDQWEPDLVCLEPPCGPWSSLQSLNPRKDLLEFKRALHMPFWTFSAKVWKKQHAAGRLVLLEQPLRSAALSLDCMRDRPAVFRAVVDQCQIELKGSHDFQVVSETHCFRRQLRDFCSSAHASRALFTCTP